MDPLETCETEDSRPGREFIWQAEFFGEGAGDIPRARK